MYRSAFDRIVNQHMISGAEEVCIIIVIDIAMVITYIITYF